MPFPRRLLACSLLTVLTSSAFADQILEIHDASLTTYVPSAKSSIQDIRALPKQRGQYPDGTPVPAPLQGPPQGDDIINDIILVCSDRSGRARDNMGELTPESQGPIAPGGGGGVAGATGPLRGDVGTVPIRSLDLYFPAAVPWPVSRSHNSRQKDSGGSYYKSGGYQGNNWFQNSQPELVFHDSETDSEDMIYLIYGADRFIEFRRGDASGTADSTDTFKAVNGASGAILLHTFDGVDLATYYNPYGWRFDFFFFDDADIDDDIEGSIWRIMDPTIEVDPYDTGDRLVTTDGKVAYVGDVGNPNTALSSGYDATTGALKKAFDSAGRRFTYSQPSGMLTSVVAEINDSGWQEVGSVDYSYYVNADSHGDDNDLKLVTVELPLSDSGMFATRKTYYRYYEGTYDPVNNPGYQGQLQYIIGPEGYRNLDWQDSSFDNTPQSALEDDLKAYASAFFKYDTDRRVVNFWTNGGCGCSGAASGEHEVEYEDNTAYSNVNAGYDYDETGDGDAIWAHRTIVHLPDVVYKTGPSIESWSTDYYDETGMLLYSVQSDSDPDTASNFWATKLDRNSVGQIMSIHSPANVTGYTHSSKAFTMSSSVGLVTVFTRDTSATDIKGLVLDVKHQKGTSGSAYLDESVTYASRSLVVGDVTVTRARVDGRRVYPEAIESGTNGSHLTSISYVSFHEATVDTKVLYLAPKKVTVTNPSVSAANNGSGASTTTTRYMRKDGSVAFVVAADGTFTYTQYVDGQLVKSIRDAKTNNATAFPAGTPDDVDDPNGAFGIAETGDGVHRVTTMAYDDQGRSDAVTQPDGRIQKTYYSVLKDERGVRLAYADYESSPSKFFGPVRYTVSNHAGSPEIQATVSLTGNESSTATTGHVDETDSDPITAMDLGAVARLTATIYEETGLVREESRLYFKVPLSGSGSDGTNYDPTTFGYDEQGRLYRSEAPHGTVTRTDFDSLGRAVHQWIGTNDSAFNGGSAGTDDMVKTLENVYDSGNDKGNSYLTTRTLFVEDSTTDERTTSFAHNERGRVLLQTNPAEPKHVLNIYDNIGRLTATAQYSTGDGTDDVEAGDDPVTRSDDRLSLSQTSFDALGRVWKTLRHKIDPADGSDDDSLESRIWYDESGRTIMKHGTQLTKTTFDRLGRQTHQFTLANDNDTTYAHAGDVTGDVVLVERQTVYDSTDSDDVVLGASISRHHGDYKSGYTTGVLDTNADGDDLLVTAGNIEGRVQITGSWYDRFGRLTDTVQYGTNDDNNLDRDGASVPARANDRLVTSYVYNTDGTRLSITDPMDLETRFEYDEAGRQTAVIANYVNGVPSASTGADDVFTRYIYTDGLRTKELADIDGNGEDAGDQVTEYTYGTTKGVSAGDSNIATGHLLFEVKYPDSASASDVVQYAYNAQNQQGYVIDQAGNVIESDYDDSGRPEHVRVTTIDDNVFDDAVLRISTTYDDLGRRELISQYNNATVGSGTLIDQVKFSYDKWGPVSKFEQDHNGEVGESESVDDYEVRYIYGTGPSGGWQVVRRTRMYMPNNAYVTYTYSSSKGADTLFDNDVSRVTTVSMATTEVANYWYNDVGQVVGTGNADIDVMSEQFNSTSGDYPNLDVFNRVTSNRWTKDLSTDQHFFDVDIAYDRNSNITLIEDNIFASHDVDYSIDDLNRLTQAEQGTWSGSAITSKSQDQIWTLDQLGNWDIAKLDLNGDGKFTGTDEYNDDRTHNVANELTGRDTDDNGSDNYSLTYDAVGNLTDDGVHYKYEYDVFGRLRKIRNRLDALVTEYTYNGLGHRIGWHYDLDLDGTVENTSDDPWYRFVYDERWRMIATYRADDSDPKEQFVHHNAGSHGFGSNSDINDVIARDKDRDTAWGTASDGTLENRVYYHQNWRHDVVAIVSSAGRMEEWAQWSSYGIGRGIPHGDVANLDGKVDVGNTDDTDLIQTWIDASTYDARGDLNLDGSVTSADKTIASANAGASLDLWNPSNIGNRRGYWGYESDPHLADAIYHVRNRAWNADLGRWNSRLRGTLYSPSTGSSPLAAGATDCSSPFVCDQYADDPGLYLACLVGCASDCDECSYMLGTERVACYQACGCWVAQWHQPKFGTPCSDCYPCCDLQLGPQSMGFIGGKCEAGSGTGWQYCSGCLVCAKQQCDCTNRLSPNTCSVSYLRYMRLRCHHLGGPGSGASDPYGGGYTPSFNP